MAKDDLNIATALSEPAGAFFDNCSTASAIFLLINNLLGLAVGFFYFGWMSDVLRPVFGDEGLRWAIYTGMGFYLVASVLLFAASKTLTKDWEE